MRHRAKCCADRSNGYANMAVFRLYRWPPSTILDFKKNGNLNRPYPYEGQNASLCQILCRSLKPFRRYGRFRFFNKAAVRHPGFLKVGNFKCPYPSGRQMRAIFCANRSRRGGNMAFLILQYGGRPPSWICYTPVWTTHELYFGGLSRCAKFVFNGCISFENMQVSIFLALSLKMPIHDPFRVFLGPKCGKGRYF